MAKGSSSSAVATTSNNTDKRIAVESGIGISSDSSAITINALDGDIVKQALQTVQMSDATAGQGFQSLLSLADKFLSGANTAIGKTQDTTLAAISAVSSAQNDAKGAVDQKTMIMLAAVAAAVVIVPKMGNK